MDRAEISAIAIIDVNRLKRQTSLILIILYATNRVRLFHLEEATFRILAVVIQGPAVSVVRIALCSTPEIRVLVRETESIAVVKARWESGKAEGIGAVAIRFPTAC